MGRRIKVHFSELRTWLDGYCKERALDFAVYSIYHMRIMDGGYTVLDIWTTGRYYVLTTDYFELKPEARISERGGEKGMVPLQKDKLYQWLDKLFYATEMED